MDYSLFVTGGTFEPGPAQAISFRLGYLYEPLPGIFNRPQLGGALPSDYQAAARSGRDGYWDKNVVPISNIRVRMCLDGTGVLESMDMAGMHEPGRDLLFG